MMDVRGAVLATCIAIGLLVLCATPVHAVEIQDRYRLVDGEFEQLTEIDPASPAGKLQAVRKLLAENENDTAFEQVQAWLEENPNDPRRVEALLLRGDARTQNREYFKALFDYERVIREYPGTEEFNIALEREYEIARLYAAGVRRKWLGFRVLPAGGEAEEIFIRIQERVPGSELGEKAHIALAEYYFGRAEMGLAAEAYDLFLQNYPNSQGREKALLRLIEANLATFKGPRFDTRGLVDATQWINQYESEFPAAAERMGSRALKVRIRESLALKELYTADWYRRQGERVSAVYLYRRLVNDAEFSGTNAALSAADRLAALGEPPVEVPLGEEAELPVDSDGATDLEVEP